MPFVVPTNNPAGPRSALQSFAFTFTVIALLVWLVAAVLGFILTGIVAMTPDNWHTWVVVRLALQIGGGVLVGLGLFMNPKVGFGFSFVCTLLFAGIGALLAVNALRALTGPRTVEGTVVSFRTAHYVGAASGIDSDDTWLDLRMPDGAPYHLHLSVHAVDLAQLAKGCSGVGDRLELAILEPLDAPLAVKCLDHGTRASKSR